MRTAGSRRNQATKVVWLGSQGGDGAGTLLCRDWFALWRRGELDGAEAAASGNRGEKRKPTTVSELYSMAKRAREQHTVTIPCQHEAEGGHGRVWKVGERTPAVGRWSCTVHQNYRIAIRFKFQITPKFSKEVENLQK